MSEGAKRKPRQLSELNDIFDFLEEVRLQPGMWVRSLEELKSILVGYRVAIEVHELDEEVDFWPLGPFSEWLWAQLGRHSSLGSSVEIEREAEAMNVGSLDLFFALVDEYRSERSQPPSISEL